MESILAKRKFQIMKYGQMLLSNGNVVLGVPGKRNYTLSHARQTALLNRF